MGDSMLPGGELGAGGAAAWGASESGAAGEGDAAGEEEEEHNVHSAASTGDRASR